MAEDTLPSSPPGRGLTPRGRNGCLNPPCHPNGATPIRAQAGFTLIEMIIVLVILGLAAGLVIARGPSRSPRVEAHSTATRLLQGMRVARAQAVASGEPVLFAIDTRGHRFSIGGAATQALPPQVSVSLDVGGHPARGIMFAPDGSSSGGRILLADATLHMAVTVDWLSGRILARDLAP